MEHEYECGFCHRYHPAENLSVEEDKLICEDCYGERYAEEQSLDHQTQELFE